MPVDRFLSTLILLAHSHYKTNEDWTVKDLKKNDHAEQFEISFDPEKNKHLIHEQ